jgi:hypothetical protein
MEIVAEPRAIGRSAKVCRVLLGTNGMKKRLTRIGPVHAFPRGKGSRG